MTAAEPVGDIHMPNPSFSPFIISLGLFIAAFGAMYMQGGKDKFWLLVAIIGLIITFGTMFLRSVIDDHGYHIHKEDLEDKGQGVMHVDEKLTNETFPAEPEKQPLRGKISLSVLVISWRRNSIVRFLIWHIFSVKEFYKWHNISRDVPNATRFHYDDAFINE